MFFPCFIPRMLFTKKRISFKIGPLNLVIFVVVIFKFKC